MSRDTHALRGRIGAYATHGRHDSRDITANARSVFLSRFDREADPDGILPDEERDRRAQMLRRAYFSRLALKSVKARAKRASERRALPDQAAEQSKEAIEEARGDRA